MDQGGAKHYLIQQGPNVNGADVAKLLLQEVFVPVMEKDRVV
jgi:hypothetical protein